MRAQVLMLLCLSGVATPIPAQPIDPHDPAALMAHARQAMREGDFRTACVLLWRADQLAPHDKRLNLAWRELDALQKGQPVGDEPVAKADPVAAPPSAKPVAPEPPAPWPAK